MLRKCGARAVRVRARPLQPGWLAPLLTTTLDREHAWAACRPKSSLSLCSSSSYHSTSTSKSPADQSVTPLRKQLKDDIKSKRAQVAGGASGPKRRSAKQDRLDEWELTVGIEIHAQLNTTRKLFSLSSTAISQPNKHISGFDLSIPGTLPRFQRATLIPALRAAIALNCEVQPVSRFDRKHYFYHDQPAGYQITQYYEPFAKDGGVVLTHADGLPLGKEEAITIGIKQVQMEQDTARTQEYDEDTLLIDYNRAGHPLIEIISLPHIHSPEVASAYVRKVQALLFSVDAVTTGMEMGGLRADVNVSVRRRGDEPGQFSYSGVRGLGQRTEIKNLSTLKGVEDAIKAERDRQIAVLEAGGVIEGETRGWSITSPGETKRLRGKEGEVDYRYMPDPDLAPLYIGRDLVEHLAQTLPKVPDQMLLMLTDKDGYSLALTDAKILLSLDSGERLDYFQLVVQELASMQSIGDKAKTLPELGHIAANWVLQELGSLMTTFEQPWSENKVSSSTMAKIINELSSGKITGSSAKQILKLVFQGDQRSVDRIVEEENLAFQPLSPSQYETLADKVMTEYPDHVRQIREKGQLGKIKFLVGQMMRTGEDGRVEAKKAEEILRQLVLESPANHSH